MRGRRCEESATADLLAYARDNGLRFDAVETPAGSQWTARLELYLSDPVDYPDLNEWDTQLAFKLAD